MQVPASCCPAARYALTICLRPVHTNSVCVYVVSSVSKSVTRSSGLRVKLPALHVLMNRKHTKQHARIHFRFICRVRIVPSAFVRSYTVSQTCIHTCVRMQILVFDLESECNADFHQVQVDRLCAICAETSVLRCIGDHQTPVQWHSLSAKYAVIRILLYNARPR